jgi:hypothetical protein
MRQPSKATTWGVALILALLVGTNRGLAGAPQPRPYSKAGPLWVDFDMESIPEPTSYETGYIYDFADNVLFQQVKQAFDFPRAFRKLAGKPKEAYNVNTLDEVPDSSWFINRNGRRPMSLEEIKRGPNVNDGPADGPLTVFRGKTTGFTQGFWVRDERGDAFILKFDPPEYPELASAAEVISTKLFHAIGYNVPQNTIFRFRREQLRMDPKATFNDSFGRRRAMTESDVDEILKRVARQPDGAYRCVASRFLAGKPKGSFTFLGLRPDDPNDIIPHEHRRDLRGLRVFSAWLEHNDMRTANTLDVYVTEGGRQFLRHYLIDFGSTLGAETVFPNPPGVGHEYQLDFSEAAKVLFTLGIYQQPWYKREPKLLYPSVGIYSADEFDPPRWKQEFPLVAFENMTDRDGYWAAKIVASFTHEQIKAAVETGELSDPKAADYLVEQIVRRRDKIARYYFSRWAAIDRFALTKLGDAFHLRFDDLRAMAAGDNSNGQHAYEYELSAAAEPKKILARGSTSTPQLRLARELAEKIGACGGSDADRGVARLTLARRGDKQVARVYLYYDSSRAQLRIVGAQQE